MRARARAHVGHAVRVALVATGVVAVGYTAAVGAFDAVVAHRQTGQADDRLADTLRTANAVVDAGAAGTTGVPPVQADPDDAPLYLWRVDARGRVLAATARAPALPGGSWSESGIPTGARIAASTFRLEAVRTAFGDWLVAGVSMADQRHAQGVLLAGELVGAPVVLVGMFLGALVVGVSASAPVEEARRRQLEFTADASHELRTPLSVIEAEVDLALGRPRDAADYRQALDRVRHESGRLRRIVEDLLWLGRFDAAPPPPAGEPIDLGTVATACVERFGAVAAARDLRLRYVRRGSEPSWLVAPAEWADRLAGVLVDNACRYTPPGGTAQVVVDTTGGRVTLVVEDSGPGIPPAERSRLFDRFHRASDEPGGSGLGLAIADAVVEATGGRWEVGDSDLGGARLAVSWHRHRAIPAAPSGAGDRMPDGTDPVPGGTDPRPAPPAGRGR